MITMFWEQESFKLPFKTDDEFTPIELCEHLGAEGRSALYDVLICNYRLELKAEIKSIESFERKHFKRES